MGLYASFDVIGDFGFIEATETWGIEPNYGDGCDAFVSTFLSSATGLVPVDTGYLQSTIGADTDGHSFCECEADAEYAQYVEYGTWKMAAQPYFTPALEEALAAAEPLWQLAQEEAIREDEMLTEEEEAEREAQAQAQQQGNGPQVGGVSYGGSLAQMAAQVIATAIVAMVVAFVQAATGHDFTKGGDSDGKGKGDSGGGMVFLPDIIIT